MRGPGRCPPGGAASPAPWVRGEAGLHVTPELLGNGQARLRLHAGAPDGSPAQELLEMTGSCGWRREEKEAVLCICLLEPPSSGRGR